ncbi:MAG: hypothetical protein IJL26_09725 [Clostridia bacterium]|nr:hypothetical protein [Clostridia bacterium]
MLRSGAVVTAISAAMVIGLLLLFTGNDEPTAGTHPPVTASPHTAVQQPTATAAPAAQTVLPAAVPTDAPTAAATTLYYGAVPPTTIPPATHTTAPAPRTTAAAPQTDPEAPADGPAAQYTSADGSLHVDVSPENRFIQIVSKQSGISPSLLTAVYTLPDKGQNYVLEWNGETDASGKILRTADTVRRCYLIDISGRITDVAASDFNESVGMNRIENSVAMESMIKKILIPAIEKAIN